MALELFGIGCGLVGLLAILYGFLKLRKGGIFSGLFFDAMGFTFILLALILSGISSHLYTYGRLSHEQKIAEVRIKSLAPQYYQVSLRFTAGDIKNFNVRGDEWQLEVRMLKWSPWANLLGLDSVYRLERLSGRYHKLQQEHQQPRSVYALSDNNGIDLWHYARRFPDFLPFVDAIYGSAAFVPMTHNAQYMVNISQSGLVIRNKIKDMQISHQ